MIGFVVSATYRIVDDKPAVILYGRLKNNESFRAQVSFTPYFYIRAKDEKKARSLIQYDFEKSAFRDFGGNPVARVVMDRPQNVPQARRTLEEEGIVTFEADIRFVQRFFIDNGLMGALDIDGDYAKGKQVDRVYENPRIRPANDIVLPSTLVFDIETDKDVKSVYSYSLVMGKTREVHVVTPKKGRTYYSYDDEKSLLSSFVARVCELDPDIISGWNPIDFDLKVLERRMKAHSIPFAIGRDDEVLRLRIVNDFFRESSAVLSGRIVFDAISILKQTFQSFPDYKLDTVAEKVLNEKKTVLEDGFWDNFTEIVRDSPHRVAEYNLRDSLLVQRILRKKKLIELMQKKSMLTGMQLDRVKGSVASLDSLYIREARARGIVCPNASFADREERIKGAYVMEPRPGIYDNVVVLDFKSLYPSIIRTYNIDPFSFDPGGSIIAPNNARFRNEPGILPEIIEKLAEEREKAKSDNDSVKSYAIKIIMNSFYGVLANPSCRFYSRELGNAITSFARQAIKETADIIKKKGYDVLYGDTDSVFVDLHESSIKEARNKGENLAAKINRHFDRKVKKEHGRTSFLELQFDKVFRVLLLPRLRTSTLGAKKRYAGLVVEDGEERVSVTGMELVRRDWTGIAKRVQAGLLDRIFHKKEVAGFLRQVIEELREGRCDDELIYRKSIRKHLHEYTKTTPPHVKAARMLPRLKSNVIEYYQTVDGPVPVEIVRQKGIKIDYDHYIEKQIRPIAESILTLFDTDLSLVLGYSKQKNLFDYD